MIVVLPAPHSKFNWNRLRPTLQLLLAAGLVSAISLLMPRLNARPLTTLLGLAVGVIVAALVSGRRGAWLAIALAAVLGALYLPPGNSLYIAPQYRLGYGLFLALCLLTTLYHHRAAVCLWSKQTNKNESGSTPIQKPIYRLLLRIRKGLWKNKRAK